MLKLSERGRWRWLEGLGKLNLLDLPKFRINDDKPQSNDNKLSTSDSKRFKNIDDDNALDTVPDDRKLLHPLLLLLRPTLKPISMLSTNGSDPSLVYSFLPILPLRPKRRTTLQFLPPRSPLQLPSQFLPPRPPSRLPLFRLHPRRRKPSFPKLSTTSSPLSSVFESIPNRN
jgi:hypothetical protein